MRSDALEIVVETPAAHGEGPVWDERRGGLWWLDTVPRHLHFFDAGTGVDTARPTPVAVGALALRPDGGFVLAADLGFATYDPDTGSVAQQAEVSGGAGRMNDGKCDPSGRFVAGTMVSEPDRSGALYRWDGARVERLVDGVTISNGLGWSPDGATFYYVDTPREQLWAFDYDAGPEPLSNRRVVVDFHDVPGRPDGLAVDADGFVWVAMARDGATVRRYGPDGRPDRVVELPAPTVTSVAFGGPDLAQLYITTSRARLRPDEAPSAGCLFRLADPGTRGLAAHEFTAA